MTPGQLLLNPMFRAETDMNRELAGSWRYIDVAFLFATDVQDPRAKAYH